MDNDILTDGITATIDHFGRLRDKQATIKAAVDDSFDVIESMLSKVEHTPEAAAAIYADDRFDGYRNRLARALGYYTNDLREWVRFGAPGAGRQGRTYRGTFPVSSQMAPKSGMPVAYALFQGSEVVYVGSTMNTRSRLKQHWMSSKKEFIDGWEVYLVDELIDARQLEADLIFQHQPRFNVQGRRRRLWPT